MPDFSGIGFSGAADGDCCDCGECPVTTVDFEDGTPNAGSLTPPTIADPWEIADEDSGKRLRFNSTAEGEKLWTVPVIDDGGVTRFSCAADVLGDVESAPAGNGGGVTIKGTDWTVKAWIEEGEFRLRADFDGGIAFDSVALEEPFSGRVTLQLTTVCAGRTGVRGVAQGGGTDAQLGFNAEFSIEPASFPADVSMGVYAPVDAEDGGGGEGQQPLSACCPEETGCYSIDMEATGSLYQPADPCDPNNCVGRTEPLAEATGAIECGGSPISLTGFDPAEHYYLGEFPASSHPVSGVDAFFGHKLLVYCDGTDLRWAQLDSGNCVVDSGTFDTVDCEARTATVRGWASATADCCDGFGATAWQIDLAWSLVPCPDTDPREYDNLSVSACGGRTPPECPAVEPDDCWDCFNLPQAWELVVPDQDCFCDFTKGTWELGAKTEGGVLYYESPLMESDNGQGFWSWRMRCDGRGFMVLSAGYRIGPVLGTCGPGFIGEVWARNGDMLTFCPIDEETAVPFAYSETGLGTCTCTGTGDPCDSTPEYPYPPDLVVTPIL